MDAEISDGKLLNNKEHFAEKPSETARIIRDQLHRIVENMSDDVLIVDRYGKYRMYNQTYGKYTTPGPGSIKENHDMLELYDVSGQGLAYEDTPAAYILKNQKFVNKEFIMRIQGREKYISACGTPVYGSNDENIAGVICLRDITAEMKERKLLAEEMQKQFEIFSILIHEFKTPLTVINAAVQALEIMCKEELKDKSKGFIGMIKQNSLRQLRLVNNLLDIMKMESGYLKEKRANTDIVLATEAIIESVRLYAEEKGVKLSFFSHKASKLVSIDDEKYERILLNLLSNAIKFTPSGKSIDIELSLTKDKLCIKVKDEGVGIPLEKLDLVFNMFGQVDNSLTRKAEGTGIGLALVKMLVGSMNGEITVNSKEDSGSTFTLLLPLHKPLRGTEAAGCSMAVGDNRLIQAAAIEFSNIYL